MKIKKPFLIIYWFGIVLAILVIGISGFMGIEGYSFLDAVYMTVITVTTIGYHEVQPLNTAGKVFNIFLILTSFSLFTYVFARVTQFVISGEMAEYFKNRKIMKAIELLNNHVIVCGFGRNGRQAAQTLRTHKVPFAVIENKEENILQWLNEDHTLIYISGDATDDEILIKAGIKKARALIITLPMDSDNVFIVLSARNLNPSIQIISRASQLGTEAKLKKAGANSVIMPDRIGGTHMATLVSKPDVIEFIDYLSGAEGESISMESVDYGRLPPEIRDKSLQVIMDWKKTGVNCIGIKDEYGKFFINPPNDTIVSKGMKVIVLGTRAQIEAMKHNVEEAL